MGSKISTTSGSGSYLSAGKNREGGNMGFPFGIWCGSHLIWALHDEIEAGKGIR